MKVVAATKLKKEEKKAVGSRPFFKHIENMLSDLVQGGMGENHPYLSDSEKKKTLILVISSDRGLCGSFNTSLTRKVYEFAQKEKKKGKEVSFFVAGVKGVRFFEAKNEAMFKTTIGIDKKDKVEIAKELSDELTQIFVEKKFDEICVAFNAFHSRSSYSVELAPYLPLSFSEGDDDGKSVHSGYFDFEPSSQAVLDLLLPLFLEVKIYRALVESQASEESARMLAMDYASENANEIIEDLTLQYNRLRQASITKELSEIVGGAEALQ